MPKEQKWYCRESKGSKGQLLISKAILQECKSRKKNLCLTWIIFQKDFNIVPNIWIVKSLEFIEINNKIIPCTKKTTNFEKQLRNDVFRKEKLV
jgi:hypothetical protein